MLGAEAEDKRRDEAGAEAKARREGGEEREEREKEEGEGNARREEGVGAPSFYICDEGYIPRGVRRGSGGLREDEGDNDEGDNAGRKHLQTP